MRFNSGAGMRVPLAILCSEKEPAAEKKTPPVRWRIAKRGDRKGRALRGLGSGGVTAREGGKVESG